jgi:predicted lipoprotein with Yx(FWY)xxD motif
MQQRCSADPGCAGRRRHVGLALALAVVILCACGCGGSAVSRSATGTATSGGTPAPGGLALTITARSLPRVGTVLVNSQGLALYVFAPDHHRAITCKGACLGTWPPVMLPSGSRLTAGAGVKPGLLGSDPDPSGGRVVTYAGWPLYLYTGDVQPGQATGQNLDLNGGEWYVIRPSGLPLIPRS